MFSAPISFHRADLGWQRAPAMTNGRRLIIRMRLPQQISKLSPARLISRVDVRTRIVIIAMIPLLGFLANGVAFMTAQSEIESAFQSAHRAADVAEASREFKMALTAMRMGAREFAAHPSYDDVKAFAVAHDGAIKSLDAMANSIVVAQKDAITAMRTKVGALKESFSGLIR